MLASPLGGKRIVAIDPAFHTGCKTVVLDASGKMLEKTVLHATTASPNQLIEAAKELLGLIQKHTIAAIANASRETKAFVRKLKLPASIPIIVVNESGASIYSASDVAREEFPDFDLTARAHLSATLRSRKTTIGSAKPWPRPRSARDFPVSIACLG